MGLQACREVLSVPSFRFTSSTHFFFPPPSPSPPPPPPQRTFLPATPHPMMDPSTPRSIQPLHLKPRPRHIIHERKRKIKPNQTKPKETDSRRGPTTTLCLSFILTHC